MVKVQKLLVRVRTLRASLGKHPDIGKKLIELESEIPKMLNTEDWKALKKIQQEVVGYEKKEEAESK